MAHDGYSRNQKSESTVEEHIHSMLVGQRLHGCAHLLELLVTGVSCVPALHLALKHLPAMA